MAKLTNFIYCLNAERQSGDDGKGDSINALGVLSALTPEFVPGTFSFSIIFSVLDIDISVNNEIRVVFSKEDQAEPLTDTGDILIPPVPDMDEAGLPAEYKGLDLTLDFRNVIFETEGLYYTIVIFNGQTFEKVPIYVKGRR